MRLWLGCRRCLFRVGLSCTRALTGKINLLLLAHGPGLLWEGFFVRLLARVCPEASDETFYFAWLARPMGHACQGGPIIAVATQLSAQGNPLWVIDYTG